MDDSHAPVSPSRTVFFFFCVAMRGGGGLSRDDALAALRYSGGAAPLAPEAAPLSAAVQRKADAEEEVRNWMSSVLQPGPGTYEGHGVARPSAFIKAGPSFARQFAKLMADRGGPGSWMWKRIPGLTRSGGEGLARAPGGRTAELAAESAAREAGRKAEAEATRKRRAEAARHEAAAAQFRPAAAAGGGGRRPAAAGGGQRPGGGGRPAAAPRAAAAPVGEADRAAAIAVYRALKAAGRGPTGGGQGARGGRR